MLCRHPRIFPLCFLFLFLAVSMPGGVRAAAVTDAPPDVAARLTDEPEADSVVLDSFVATHSYDQALQAWRSPEDVNAWIAALFRYDVARVVSMAAPDSVNAAEREVYEPARVFAERSGVCVDLARFAVETLRRVAPGCAARYLRVEFEPVIVDGATLRFHWLVVFTGDDGLYVFADSKRPGHIAGPYDTLEAFRAEYEQYRGRTILDYRELESYRARRKAAATAAERQ